MIVSAASSSVEDVNGDGLFDEVIETGITKLDSRISKTRAGFEPGCGIEWDYSFKYTPSATAYYAFQGQIPSGGWADLGQVLINDGVEHAFVWCEDESCLVFNGYRLARLTEPGLLSVTEATAGDQSVNNGRKTIGIGEFVLILFEGTASASWTIETSTGGELSRINGDDTTLEAPHKETSVTVRGKYGPFVKEVTFTVIKPTTVTYTHYDDFSEWESGGTRVGATGRYQVTYHPTTVSFVSADIYEDIPDLPVTYPNGTQVTYQGGLVRFAPRNANNVDIDLSSLGTLPPDYFLQGGTYKDFTVENPFPLVWKDDDGNYNTFTNVEHQFFYRKSDLKGRIGIEFENGTQRVDAMNWLGRWK